MRKQIYFFLLITSAALFLSACTETPTGNSICTLDGECGDTLESDDEYIEIPKSEISSNVKKYSYTTEGVKVNYFAVKGSDGQIKTAFDGCDSCGGYKGYSQKGNDVVCNNCGNVFSIDSIGSKNTPGGCWPSYLDHKVEGDNILISKAEIEQGSFRFI